MRGVGWRWVAVPWVQSCRDLIKVRRRVDGGDLTCVFVVVGRGPRAGRLNLAGVVLWLSESEVGDE